MNRTDISSMYVCMTRTDRCILHVNVYDQNDFICHPRMAVPAVTNIKGQQNKISEDHLAKQRLRILLGIKHLISLDISDASTNVPANHYHLMGPSEIRSFS